MRVSQEVPVPGGTDRILAGAERATTDRVRVELPTPDLERGRGIDDDRGFILKNPARARADEAD